jgi:hypothetical protein
MKRFHGRNLMENETRPPQPEKPQQRAAHHETAGPVMTVAGLSAWNFRGQKYP